MKKLFLFFLIVSTLLNCQNEPITSFSDEALNDEFIAFDGSLLSFSTILEKHKGKTIFVDVWASWCKDCVKSLSKLKELQNDYSNTTYVYLSLDKSINAWKKGIQKHELRGDHYYMQSGWNGAMGKFLDLDWIPRYIVVDDEGKIVVFRAIKTKDKNLRKHLK